MNKNAQRVDPVLQTKAEEFIDYYNSGLICSRRAAYPKPLSEFSSRRELPDFFFYDRRYGVFECGSGSHVVLMASFGAWCAGFRYEGEWAESVGIEDGLDLYERMSEYYIENTPGVCYMSGAPHFGSARVIAWERGSLNEEEIDFFGKPLYLMD